MEVLKIIILALEACAILGLGVMLIGVLCCLRMAGKESSKEENRKKGDNKDDPANRI